MADEFDAARIALTFPEAIQEGTGFRVRKKGFAWFYTEIIPGRKGRVLRMDVLAIRVANEDEKQLLIASDPAKFFTCDHYRGFPAVLVNLDQIEKDELTELLTEGWRIQHRRRWWGRSIWRPVVPGPEEPVFMAFRRRDRGMSVASASDRWGRRARIGRFVTIIATMPSLTLTSCPVGGTPYRPVVHDRRRGPQYCGNLNNIHDALPRRRNAIKTGSSGPGTRIAIIAGAEKYGNLSARSL